MVKSKQIHIRPVTLQMTKTRRMFLLTSTTFRWAWQTSCLWNLSSLRATCSRHKTQRQ